MVLSIARVMHYFRHVGLVRNMRKVGVLTNRVAPDLEALRISLAAA
jgi:hypothetical protein